MGIIAGGTAWLSTHHVAQVDHRLLVVSRGSWLLSPMQPDSVANSSVSLQTWKNLFHSLLYNAVAAEDVR